MKRGARPSLLAVVKRDDDELIRRIDRDSFAWARTGSGARSGAAATRPRRPELSSPTALMCLGSSASMARTSWASGAVLRKLGFVAVDEPSPPQACAARGGVTLPTATLRLARPQSRPSADAHPLRLIDEDA